MSKRVALIAFVFCSVFATLVACSSSKNATVVSDDAAAKSETSSREILVDSRDGQVYRTMKIGEQTWMAENLNYKTDGSECLNNLDVNCARFGRLYEWGNAMDSSAVFAKNGEGCGLWVSCSPTYPVRGICPAGWHLPSHDEWKKLISLLDKKDTVGFVPRLMNERRIYKDVGFWSSTIYDEDRAYRLFSYNNDMSLDKHSKYMDNYIRCIMDEDGQGIPTSSLLRTEHSMVDSRDGHVYRTVNIGDQTWMAENLSYDMAGSECWADDSTCDVRGRYYGWDNAKNACPVGWHLPSIAEWYTLFSAVGGQRVAGKTLKAKTGWDRCDDCEDEYGFSAMSTGIAYSTVQVSDGNADFWSFAESDSNHAYFMSLAFYTDMANIIDQDYSARSSIRCVKDGAREKVNPASLPVKVEKGVESFMTDKRDGQTYKTIKIGEQTWMAENLNYDVPGKSYCYGKIPSNCAKYGRLYEERVAMEVCPAGFHLPSPSEWETLFNAVGGQFMAGSVLKSKTGWINDGNGMDPFGFSAIPAGYGSSVDREEGKSANFWCSQEPDDENFYYVKLKHDAFNVDMNHSNNKAYSVRCVMD
ncbi:FISUMP domain-containing protein [Fibrobacter sp. UWB12]|uniref:FISUMP domain-containing protein n=1 Tax=Fibrobacter sp. UWB12 TaxID=1896203 RepID=UPI00091C6C77|nr:FISUMP domain-containing protein [Fibrobacter sp. UWB12]SHK19087.1 major paralogous domain-containing protein [Fibrobacter sp. UWB12]